MPNAYICHSYIPGANLQSETVRAIVFGNITHANIAFSTVERDASGAFVPFVSQAVRAGIRLVQQEIRRQKAETKLLISIGGYQAGNFCESCRSEDARAAFAAACLEILRETGIDGIDLDWEFPGYPTGGISCCPHCREDYILLCKEIRAVIGTDRLLTCAVGSHLYQDMDYSALNPLFDYVNVMTYDMNQSAHSAFSKTTLTMQLWAEYAFDKAKLVLGIPFYSRCENEVYEWKGYRELMELLRAGKAELLQEDDQDFVLLDGNRLSLDTPQSIARKVQWVKENGFAGVFNWQETTDDGGALRRAMAEIITPAPNSSKNFAGQNPIHPSISTRKNNYC